MSDSRADESRVRNPGQGDAADLHDQNGREKAKVMSLCEKAESHLYYRSEAGLFKGAKDLTVLDSISSQILDARNLASKGQYPEARKAIMNAYGQLHQAVLEKSRLWRARHIHCLHLYAYFAALLAILLWLGLAEKPSFISDYVSSHIWGIPVSMAAYGMLGGIVRCLFWLPQKIQSRSFRTQFEMVYVGAPWLAMLLGMFAYVLLNVGFMTLSGESGDGKALNPAVGYDSEPGFVAAAVLAGYSWEWFADKISSKLAGT